jgi:biotin-(acetyl-CoA carboxylase) ligase
METDLTSLKLWMEILTPIVAIGCGMSVALALVTFIVKTLAIGLEAKYTSDAASLWDRLTGNLEAIAERLQKRKAQDHVYPEYPALDLGLERPDEPDGELIAWDEYEREARK